jgi:hypothetical protein
VNLIYAICKNAYDSKPTDYFSLLSYFYEGSEFMRSLSFESVVKYAKKTSNTELL